MRRLLPALSLLTLLACSSKPEFIYDARPGVALETFRTVAFDPRKVAWVLEGQRPVRAEHLKRMVQEALEARGFQLVEPGAAEIWVNVVAMAPSKDGAMRGSGPGEAGPSGRGGPGGGRGPGGGMGPSGPREARPTPSQRPMAFEGLDPAGELTFMVQLLARETAQPLWTGTAHLPPQKKGEQPHASMREVVRHLLEPLPRSQAMPAR